MWAGGGNKQKKQLIPFSVLRGDSPIPHFPQIRILFSDTIVISAHTEHLGSSPGTPAEFHTHTKGGEKKKNNYTFISCISQFGVCAHAHTHTHQPNTTIILLLSEIIQVTFTLRNSQNAN